MNRFVLTAKLLITHSWLVRIAWIAFAVVSLVMAAYGQAIPVVILFACLLAGAGFTSRSYLRSERRQLVPGMNESCAGVCIAFLILSTTICVTFIGFLHGFQPETIGGCFCGLAFALWVGTFEKTAAFAMILVYLLPLSLVNGTGKKLIDAYGSLPQAVHFAAGVLLAVLGVAIAARYWFIITSKYSPFVYQKTRGKQELGTLAKCTLGISATALVVALVAQLILSYGEPRSVSEWIEAAGTTALHTIVAFAIVGVLYAVWRGMIEWFSPTDQSLTDIGHFLFGKANGGNSWKMLPWMIAGVFVISFMSTKVFLDSSSDEAIHAKLAFGLIFPPFIMTVSVLHGITKLFSRLWLKGVSDNRCDTAKVLLLTLMARMLPSVLLVIACIVTMSMSTTVGVAPVLFATIFSVAISPVTIWAIVKIYPFITRHVGFFVLVYLGIAGTALVTTVTVAHNLILNVAEMIQPVGPWVSIVAIVLVTTGIAMLCVWDAARSMGASSKLMEAKDEFLVVNPQ